MLALFGLLGGIIWHQEPAYWIMGFIFLIIE